MVYDPLMHGEERRGRARPPRWAVVVAVAGLLSTILATGVSAASTHERSVDGLVALYRFDEGGGGTVADSAPAGVAPDLLIGEPSAVTWGDGVLTVNGPAAIASTGPARELTDAIAAAGAVTIEAWVRPANVTQDGPARIVTLSDGPRDRNLTLGQGLWGSADPARFDVRLRTSTTSTNGTPSLSTPPGTATTALTHVAYRWSPDGRATLFVDGTAVASGTVEGDLTTWDPSYRLGLADEIGGGRPWVGALDLVAVYARALGDDEIAAHHAAGPDAPLEAPDTAAPRISDLEVTTTADGATFAWTTDEPATSVVRIGTTPAYGRTEGASELVTGHRLDVAGLTCDTVHHWSVESADGAGNTTTTPDATLRTGPCPDPDPPPEPGTTYREVWVPHSEFTGGCHDSAGGSWYIEPSPSCTKTLRVDLPFDPAQADRVEVFLDLWRNRSPPAVWFTINGGPPIRPDVGSDWSRTPWTSGDLRAQLTTGTNTLVFGADAAAHVHDVVIRAHFSSPGQLGGTDAAAPDGGVTSVGGVAPGSTIDLDALPGGRLAITADAADTGSGVAYVQIVGRYDGYDEDNDGLTRDWHILSRNNWGPGASTQGDGSGTRPTGSATHHVGSDATAPWEVSWDPSLVPAQDDVWFKARIVDAAGNVRETAPVGPYRLHRSASEVRWIRPAAFTDAGLHMGGNRHQEHAVTFDLGDDLTGLSGAVLIGNYWGNPQVTVNGGSHRTVFGWDGDPTDRWDLSRLPLDLEDLRPGTNTVRFRHNLLEVPFGAFIERPGPVIVLTRRLSGPPRIERHPRQATAVEGAEAGFDVVASGGGLTSTSFRWQRDIGSGFEDIGGATGPTLTVPPVTAEQTGTRFRVVVTAGGETVTSLPAVLTVTPVGGSPSGPWAHPGYERRILVRAGAGPVPRSDRWAVAPLPSGASGVPDGAAIRLVEVDSAGAVVDPDVPVEVADPEGDGTDRVVLLMRGATPAGTVRAYHLYVDTDGSEAPTPVADTVVVTPVVDEGQDAFSIATPTQTLVLQRAAGALSSLLDDRGVDWIDHRSSAAGTGGAFRGYPNVADTVFHPGATTAVTTLLHDGPLSASFRVETTDGLWAYRLDVFGDRAEFTVEDFPDRRCGVVASAACETGEAAAGTDFWWQYEGVPGGSLGSEDRVVRPGADGVGHVANDHTANLNEDLNGPEWIGVVDRTAGRAVLNLSATDDPLPDLYRRFVTSGQPAMAAVAFGRLAATGGGSPSGVLPYRPADVNRPVVHRFTLALAGAADEAATAAAARDLGAPPVVAVGSAEDRPPAGASGEVWTDPFDGSGLDPAWTFVDPLGDGSVAVGGGAVTISVPGGTSHNPWDGVNPAPRIERPAPAGDFSFEADIASTVSRQYQMNGLMVLADDGRFVRYDLFWGKEPRLFAAVVHPDGSEQVLVNQRAPSAGEVSLRIVRTAAGWSFQHGSPDAWVEAATVPEPLTAARLALFAANHASGSSSPPAHDGVFSEARMTAEASPPPDDPPPEDTRPARFDLFYGSDVTFGVPGVAQRWLNVPGNVTDPDGVTRLEARLDGGPWQTMGLGPEEPRLPRPGDFNVEIDTQGLTAGAHRLELRATDARGDTTTEEVTIRHQPGNRWPLPYRADWSSGPVTGLAQPVDGRWLSVPGGVASDATGFDRLLAIGDATWADYEVVVPITVHSVDPAGYPCPSCGPGIGVLARWNGHGADAHQPHRSVIPLGGLLWYRYRSDGSEGLEARNHKNKLVDSDAGFVLSPGTTYVFKLQVWTNPASGKHRYRLRVWEQGTPEPGSWQLVMWQGTTAPAAGSVLLVAHWVDATFGDVDVRPL